MAKIRRMFPGGNTSEGSFSYHKYILGKDGERLYILKGVPGGGKSSMMKDVAKEMLEKGFSIEYHHCPSDKESVDGIVIEELNVAIVDGTFPHIIDPVYPGLYEKIINLGEFVNEDKLLPYKDKIVKAKTNNTNYYRRTYAYFRGAREIREEIKSANKQRTDLAKVYRNIEELEKRLFENVKHNTRLGIDRHLFSSAYTPEGFVDFTETLLENMDNVYYITGEIGTGKSMLLDSIFEKALRKGLNAEVYHNPLMPKEIDTLIIPELKTVISTNAVCDRIYTETIDFNKYMDNFKKIEEDYKMFGELISIGLSSLKKAKENHELLEEYYYNAVDYNEIDEVKRKIITEILFLT